MAKYTIELRTLLNDPQSKELILQAMSTYPLYTPENKSKFTQVMSREELNNKILNHYKYREIGFETFGRFLDELEIALNEIMPYYNQLFNSEDIINGLDDIFGNLDVTESFEENTSSSGTLTGSESLETSEESSGNSKSTSEGSDSSSNTSDMTTSSKNVNSKEPQSEIDTPAENIDNLRYADEIDWNKSTTSSTTDTNGSTSSETNNEESSTKSGTSSGNREQSQENTGKTTHTLTRKGNQGVNTYAHDMLEFRKLFLNIAQMIINDKMIKDLFMQIY